MKTTTIMFVMAVGIFVGSLAFACSMMGGGSHQGDQQGHAMAGHQGSHQATGGAVNHDAHGAQQTDAGTQAPQIAQQQQSQVQNQDQARTLVQDYLNKTSDEHLMISSIVEDGDYYKAEIVDHGGAFVDTIRVDKNTGTLQSAYAGN